MCDTPSLRNIILKKFGQFSACLSRNIISPGSERNQKISFFVKWHVAVHHGTDSNSTNACQLHTIFLLYILCHLLITVLQTGPDIFQTVCPYTILIAVLPLVSAGCDWCIISIYQNCLNSCGTKLDSKCCPVVQDCLLCFCCSHV